MGGKENRAVAGQALDQAADVYDLGGVEADCRLVQDQQFGSVQNGLGKTDPLAEAFG